MKIRREECALQGRNWCSEVSALLFQVRCCVCGNVAFLQGPGARPAPAKVGAATAVIFGGGISLHVVAFPSFLLGG